MHRFFISVALILGLVGTNVSVAASRPRLMGVMGDSLTAAAFANVPLPLPAGFTAEEWVKNWEAEALRPEVLIENKRTLSWASGRWIRSHSGFLKRYLSRMEHHRRLHVFNVARTGDRASDIPFQALKIAKAMTSDRYEELTYVALFIGGNDVCVRQRDEDRADRRMKQSILEGLRIISQAGAQAGQKSPIRVMVVGLPRIQDLGQEKIRKHRTLFGLSCEKVRDRILKSCNVLTDWRTPEQYERATALVERKNRLLAEVAAEAGALYPGLEVLYAGGLYEQPIRPEMLAVDCFHSSATGQQVMSDVLWKEIPWFK